MVDSKPFSRDIIPEQQVYVTIDSEYFEMVDVTRVYDKNVHKMYQGDLWFTVFDKMLVRKKPFDVDRVPIDIHFRAWTAEGWHTYTFHKEIAISYWKPRQKWIVKDKAAFVYTSLIKLKQSIKKPLFQLRHYEYEYIDYSFKTDFVKNA
jgi:hypothetical protein